MALFLLFHSLLEGLDKLLKASQRINFGLLFIRQVLLELGPQPVVRNQGFQQVVEVLDTFKVSLKGAVKLVEVALVLNQAEPSEVVELFHIRKGEPLLQGFQKIQEFPQTGRHLRAPNFKKKINQHKT